jgi:hypothetical protein
MSVAKYAYEKMLAQFFKDSGYLSTTNTAASLQHKARSFRKTTDIYYGDCATALSAVNVIKDDLFFIFGDVFPKDCCLWREIVG